MNLIHLITSATVSLTASSSLAQDISFRADATASVALGRAVLDCLAATPGHTRSLAVKYCPDFGGAEFGLRVVVDLRDAPEF